MEFTATTQLTAPTGTICPGGSAVFQCITSGTGQLIWTIDGLSAGTFNSASDNVGATSETVQGVIATLTAENEAQSRLTSSLNISSAGVVVESGATITCSDAVASGNTQSAQLLVTCKFELCRHWSRDAALGLDGELLRLRLLLIQLLSLYTKALGVPGGINGR